MKTLIAFILSVCSLHAATTYPLLTDNPARTFTGGGTNIAGLTNSQTFTGTNTFPAAGFYPANGIGVRLLWASPTNIYLNTLPVFAGHLSNNGDYSSGTYFAKFECPALLGAGSTVAISQIGPKTNANLGTGLVGVYVGPNTNWVLSFQAWNSSLGMASTTISSTLFGNAGSFTNQGQGNLASGVVIPNVTNFVDTSSPFTIYMSAYSLSGFTNLLSYGFRVYEVYSP